VQAIRELSPERIGGSTVRVSDEQQSHSDQVVEFIPALRAFARSLTRDAVYADDLVQETLVKAIAKRDQFRPGTNLRAWLFTIMRNTFYNELKKRARERTGSADCASSAAETPSTQEWSLRGRELIAAVNRLPPHYRETLILVVMLGETYEDSARICGCEIGTIKSRVARARAMVMTDLGGGFS
jgi:RNA polymerase sigma factor (sigma-70 family)